MQAIDVGIETLEYALRCSSHCILEGVDLEEKNSELGALKFTLLLLHRTEELNRQAIEVCEASKAAFLRSLVIGERLGMASSDKIEQQRRDILSFRLRLDNFIGARSEYDALYKEYELAHRTLRAYLDDEGCFENCTAAEELQGDTASTQEIMRFLKDSGTMAIMFFSGFQYKALGSGKLKRSLHAICLWNEEAQVHTCAHIVDVGFGSGSCMVMNLDEDVEQREEVRQRRRDHEAKYLAELGVVIREIFGKARVKSAPTKLVIVPHRGMHKIPFAAVPIPKQPEGKGDDHNGVELLGDIVTNGIWTVPNLSICKHLYSRRKATHEEREKQELHNALRVASITCPNLETGVQFISSVDKAFTDFTSRVLLKGSDADPEIVTRSADVRKCNVMNINSHGLFANIMGEAHIGSLKARQVLHGSGLRLGDKMLSMTDIWKMRLENCQVVCVVACSSGVVYTGSGNDQSLSIGSAFLVAGAQHVVCTLWPVNQVAAIMVMSRFYKLLGPMMVASNGRCIASCLAEAQRWYRELSAEEYNTLAGEMDLVDYGLPDNRHFYNWATFTVLGPPE